MKNTLEKIQHIADTKRVDSIDGRVVNYDQAISIINVYNNITSHNVKKQFSNLHIDDMITISKKLPIDNKGSDMTIQPHTPMVTELRKIIHNEIKSMLSEELLPWPDVNGNYAIAGYKRVFVRSKGRTDVNIPRSDARFVGSTQDDVIGWFHIRKNYWGWAILKLSDYDKKWLKAAGLSNFTGIFRTVSDSDTGHTNIIRIFPKKGTFSFMDWEKEDDPRGAVAFEKATPYSKLLIDEEKYEKYLA